MEEEWIGGGVGQGKGLAEDGGGEIMVRMREEFKKSKKSILVIKEVVNKPFDIHA